MLVCPSLDQDEPCLGGRLAELPALPISSFPNAPCISTNCLILEARHSDHCAPILFASLQLFQICPLGSQIAACSRCFARCAHEGAKVGGASAPARY